MVVWDSRGSAGSDTSDASIQGQRYDASGNAVGAEFQVNSYTTSWQYNPSVAIYADGDFVVVWQSWGSAGSDLLYSSIQGQRYDASGSPVGNGYLPTREIRCGVGPIRVRQPRVHDARVDAHGRRHRFASTVLPAYARTTTCIGRPAEDAFFHGMAIGDMTRAFQATFGSITAELPQSFLPRLRELWEADRERMNRRSYHGREFAQLWGDAIPVPEDADEADSCSVLLAATTPEGVDVLDVRLGSPDGEEAWSDLFADLQRRGLTPCPDRLHQTTPEPARAAFQVLARRAT